jgi:hypothetical protein
MHDGGAISITESQQELRDGLSAVRSVYSRSVRKHHEDLLYVSSGI